MERQKASSATKDLKVKKLLTRLTILSVCIIIFLSVLIFSLNLSFGKREKLQKQIKTLEFSNRDILNEVKDIENKSITAKNYIRVWNTEFPEQQKLLKGIDITSLGKEITKIGEIDNLKDIIVNFSPVILVGGTYERKNVRTYTALISVKFTAVTDINVFKFLDDLKQKLGYFIVIQEISLERIKKIDDEFLKALKTPESASAINGEIKIRLYGLGEK